MESKEGLMFKPKRDLVREYFDAINHIPENEKRKASNLLHRRREFIDVVKQRIQVQEITIEKKDSIYVGIRRSVLYCRESNVMFDITSCYRSEQRNGELVFALDENEEMDIAIVKFGKVWVPKKIIEVKMPNDIQNCLVIAIVAAHKFVQAGLVEEDLEQLTREIEMSKPATRFQKIMCEAALLGARGEELENNLLA